MNLIGTCLGWELHHWPERDGQGWRTLVLVRPPEARAHKEHSETRNFNLGWNGERLSEGADKIHLARRHPDILRWVEQVLPLSNLSNGHDGP